MGTNLVRVRKGVRHPNPDQTLVVSQIGENQAKTLLSLFEQV